ncbi:MAG: OmpA family protein, partial [Zetaproteobacteria bacterium]
AQYEGTLAEVQAQAEEMKALREKLRIKREAEAKIKQLAALFSPDEAEILLTPEADVIVRLKGLHFRSGSAVIPPQGYALLDKALRALAVFPDRKVRVEGHTDAIGDAAYNQKLSERRAEAVRQYLLERLETPREIEAVGYGEERPIATNETAEGRRKNRRIDIVLPAPRR